MNMLRTSPSRIPPRRVIPQLEALEDRWVPASVSTQAQVSQTGLLRITGDNVMVNQADRITINDNGQGSVQVIHNFPNTKLIRTGVRHIVVDTRGGNDRVIYNLTGNVTQTSPTGPYTVSIGLGAGVDVLTANLNGVIATAGVGLVFGVDGGSGRDTLNVTGRGIFAANAGLSYNISGGADTDTINVDYQGELDCPFVCTIRGGADRDIISANLRFSPGSSGQLDLSVAGEGGDDTITTAVTNQGNVTLAFAQIVGGAGTDMCSLITNFAGFPPPDCEA